MKLMSDPDLTNKVMAKLGQVPQPSQAPPSPPPGSEEAPEINNLLDASRYAAALQPFCHKCAYTMYDSHKAMLPTARDDVLKRADVNDMSQSSFVVHDGLMSLRRCWGGRRNVASACWAQVPCSISV